MNYLLHAGHFPILHTFNFSKENITIIHELMLYITHFKEMKNQR